MGDIKEISPYEGIDSQLPKHPVYWFEEGSLILEAQDVQFRVHRSLLQRHSVYLASIQLRTPTIVSVPTVNDAQTLLLSITGRNNKQINSRDVEALLEHMYHDFPLSPIASFERITALIRSSSPQQFDMPVLHAQAKEYLRSFFTRKIPSDIDVDILPEALAVGRTYELPSIISIALYRAMVTSDFDLEDEAGADALPPDPQLQVPSQQVAPDSLPSLKTPKLTRGDLDLCKKLMTRVVYHFTPILFTPATASHMTCTDAFADTWMSLVISPALEDDGVYKPVETLEKLKSLDWGKHGLCSACVVEKREEWTEEQRNVWTMIDSWLEEEGGAG